MIASALIWRLQYDRRSQSPFTVGVAHALVQAFPRALDASLPPRMTVALQALVELHLGPVTLTAPKTL